MDNALSFGDFFCSFWGEHIALPDGEGRVGAEKHILNNSEVRLV